ncbi:MAG TPA: DNA polymerase III subunit alpha [Solirubrobacterales bacterium]|jgi:error-prone DNA polymerase|nr:DNA polymerase III subunit alpha [Solirubrobacterales bacterium]
MAYVELHAHSAYSFHDGVSQPHELAGAAAELGYNAFALTDHDGVYGAMEFAHACAPLGIKPILGTELTIDDGHHLTLLVENREGWGSLCRILTVAHAETRSHDAARTRGQPQISLNRLLEHTNTRGLICLSGCAARGAVSGRVENGDPLVAEAVAQRLKDAFGRDNFRIEIQRPFARHDRSRNRALAEIAGRLGVPTVATGNIHAHSRQRAPLQDVFVALSHNSSLDETEPLRRGNSSHVLAAPQQMAERFKGHPGAVQETANIAERINFDITSDLGYRYPGSGDPATAGRLKAVCESRIGERYGDDHSRGRRGSKSKPSPGSIGRRHVTIKEARARLDDELGVIEKLGLSGFFLIHHDLLELAREIALEVRGPSVARAVLPPGRGRGSSVSSIVCYLTGLSHVDPLEAELCLGRFLHEDLTSLPDIDLDFPRDIRHALIPRIHERYGRDRSALVSAFSTYKTRGCLRSLGKALALPNGEIERLIRITDRSPGEDLAGSIQRSIETSPGGANLLRSPRWQAMLKLLPEIHRLPRHVSQHSGGMVISTDPLIDLCPVMPVSMVNRQIVQWDKDSCGDAGFVKIDLLGLGMLSAVERTVDLIHGARGETVDLSRIPLDDPEVFRDIQTAETTGVFQIESRAQMQMLVRSRPETLNDIFVQVAIVRPGPIVGGAVHPYLERRKQLRLDPDYEVPYPHPILEPVLKDTLGAIVFQDQVIEVAVAMADFTPGEAEGLRRAMSRKRSHDALAAYYVRFREGAMANGVSEEVAEQVYAQIIGFSGFGFPKAHAAAFGFLAYQTSWLRCHYGPEFVCALLNEQPMGFYLPDALIHEAQRRGIPVLPADVNASDAECTVEWIEGAVPDAPDIAPPEAESDRQLAVRVGLAYIKGAKEDSVRSLVAARAEAGPFKSVADLASRSGAAAPTLERIAWAGACDNLGPNGRREALWMLGAAPAGEPLSSGVGAQLALPIEPLPVPRLRPLDDWNEMIADYGATGLTTGNHPMLLLRENLRARNIRATDELDTLQEGARATVAGLVVARQRPGTAKGVVFVLLEDERGVVNIVLPPPVYERFRVTVRSEPLLAITGKVERRTGALNVIATNVEAVLRPGDETAVREIKRPKTGEWDLREKMGDIDTDIAQAAMNGDFDAARKVMGEAADLRAVAPVGINFGRRGR